MATAASLFSRPEVAHLCYTVRCMARTPLPESDLYEWTESIDMPNCLATIIKFKEPILWAHAKEIVGPGNLYPIRCPGFPEHDGIMAAAVAEGLAGLKTKVANANLTVFDRQDARRSTGMSSHAGKRRVEVVVSRNH